jgi:hypothetical protein
MFTLQVARVSFVVAVHRSFHGCSTYMFPNVAKWYHVSDP